jgi:protease PrsW
MIILQECLKIELVIILFMIRLIVLAIAPVIAIAFYIYMRDKYEKEPIKLLLKAFGIGVLITFPVIISERLLSGISTGFSSEQKSFFESFVVAGFTEEMFKFAGLYLFIWNNRNFNEKFDGIVYAVFVSLGFAAIENMLYVIIHGTETGYIRAIVSVPAHAFFGVTMGYYVGMAKFYTDKKRAFLTRAILFPIILHGIFDFILLLQNYRLLLGFLPYVIFLYIDGLRKMRFMSDSSIYRN